METIREILIQNQGMSPLQADNLIAKAKERFEIYLQNGDDDLAEDICMEYFGLEQDYLMEFL